MTSPAERASGYQWASTSSAAGCHGGRLPATSYLSKCESGERRVDVIELEAFAKLYGKPLSFFLP
jgi:hypothetical protein